MADKPPRSYSTALLAIARGDARALADYLMFGGSPDPRIIRCIALMLDPGLLGARYTEEWTEAGGLVSVSREPMRSPQRHLLEFKAVRRPGNQPAGSGTVLMKARMAHLVFESLYPKTASGRPERAELEAGLAHGAMKAAYHTAVDMLASEGTGVAIDTVKKAYAELKDRLMEQAIALCEGSEK